MSNYEPVIGLEVHVELNTKTKMFCRCSADYFGKEPNTLTCPICLGLPGALPFINKEAIEKCLIIGLALNCTVSERSLFERKNYFYPDLAKGYQISQLRWPLNVNGWLEVKDSKGESKKIRINRAHQEEDTGKLTHLPIGRQGQGNQTLIDFNRSGVPLVEIVTEPDFTDTFEVKDYAKKLQQIFRYLGVSNADMEKGDMRLEANVSVRLKEPAKRGEQKELPPYRVELKNINSFKFMEAAIRYEIERQIKALENGKKLHQETRGWNELKKETYLQRNKEEANDYRYFPEPDLSELRIPKEDVVRLRKKADENNPIKKVQLWEKEYGVPMVSGTTLITQGTASLFESALPLANEAGIDIKGVATFIINKKFDHVLTKPEDIISAIKSQKSGMISDQTELERVCQEVVKENPEMVAGFKNGKQGLLQALIGAVMKKTAGKADPSKTKQILEKMLH